MIRRTPARAAARRGPAVSAQRPARRVALPTWLLPALMLLGLLLAWELLVRIAQIPAYTLPAPSLVVQTLVANFGSLAGSQKPF